MVQESFKERRKALRNKRILSIQYRLAKSKNKSADTRWYLSTTHDMSIVGISFLSEAPFLVDDILELHIIMSGVVDVFKGFGKVVRVERKKTGAHYFIAVKVIQYNPRKPKAATKTASAKTKLAPNRK